MCVGHKTNAQHKFILDMALFSFEKESRQRKLSNISLLSGRKILVPDNFCELFKFAKIILIKKDKN